MASPYIAPPLLLPNRTYSDVAKEKIQILALPPAKNVP